MKNPATHELLTTEIWIMSNLPAEREQGTAIATGEDYNPYIDYGNTADRSNIVGKLLKFTKLGDWVYGENADPLPEDTRLIAHMGDLAVGWIKWEDGRPVETIMGLIRDRGTPKFQVPSRGELGDNDKADWPVDANGVARDPWQSSNWLILMDPEGQLYTFAPTSKGGKQAIAKLSKVYGEKMRHRPGEFPVVTLSGDEYAHPNKQYGMIQVPVMTLVGWAKRKIIDDALNVGSQVNEPALALEPDKPARTVPPRNDYAAAKGDRPSAKSGRF
jgi:hypothetical protein